MMQSVAIKYAERDIQNVREALFYVRDKRVALQAGGCFGTFARYLAGEFGSVIVAEPDPRMFSILASSTPDNVVRLQVALGDMREMVRTVQRRRDGDMTRKNHEGVTHVVAGGIIPTIRVDDLNLQECNFMCLDVEGYELYALQGAVETIRRCRPVIMVEINSCIEALGLRGDDVRTFLQIENYERVRSVRSDEIYAPRGNG